MVKTYREIRFVEVSSNNWVISLPGNQQTDIVSAYIVSKKGMIHLMLSFRDYSKVS